jgi:hypothetical protein
MHHIIMHANILKQHWTWPIQGMLHTSVLFNLAQEIVVIWTIFKQVCELSVVAILKSLNMLVDLRRVAL